jgi:uncharacterized protein (TIGR03000 family)
LPAPIPKLPAPQPLNPQGANPSAAPTIRLANSVPTGSDGDVTLVIRVPTDAVVSINGIKTTQTGERREFVSSGLVQGKSYTFEVRAEWQSASGKTIELQQKLVTHAGERRVINFANPSDPPRIELAPPAGTIPTRLPIPGSGN